MGLDVETAGARAMVMQSGWVSLGSGPGPVARLHLVVRSEPDPRFVLEFGGEPECSPVVYQVQGSGSGGGLMRQPVFSCRFSTDRRRTTRSRSADILSREIYMCCGRVFFSVMLVITPSVFI